MFVVCRKDNPLVLKAYGQTLSPGGLCQFDPTVYEEIEVLQLPEGWTMELPQAQQIINELEALWLTMSQAEMAAFYPLKAGVNMALQENQIPVAKLMVQNAPTGSDPALQTLQNNMLALFP